MDGQGDSGSSSSQTRWTCEACGCHTNTNESNSLSCGICGTRREPSVLSRVGHSAASRFFRGSFAARRDALHADYDDDEEVMDHLDPDDIGDDDDEYAVAALALEVAGVTGVARAGDVHEHLNRRLRSLGGVSASMSVSGEGSEPPPPDEILLAATENSALFQPKWADMAQLAGRNRHGNGIILGSGSHQNVAYLPVGAGEGRPVRTLEAFPRGTLPPRNLSTGTSTRQERKRKRAFGFRVAFDHPRRDTGVSMGGCYLVGVTTQAFTAFSERNGLHQSRFFWGIEDGGSKFEGHLLSNTSRAPERGGSSNHGVEINRNNAPRNSDNVLFGSKEVITVVADLETRTLTYWRNGRLIGTLVSNLPRTGNIYPVVVPFNSGVSVAISSMDESPLPLLRSFVSDWKHIQKEKEGVHRRSLVIQRTVLVQNSKPTSKLISVLKTIFNWYAQSDNVQRESGSLCLNPISAFRLWYRCGIKHSSLQSILEKRLSNNPENTYYGLFVTFEDFLNLISQIIQEEEAGIVSNGSIFDSPSQESPNLPSQILSDHDACEVGDRVELVDIFENYGDASSGPLQPGDRGGVVEIQHGPKGECHSIRVLYNGRRWWYQPQALLTERSGLIDSPAVWFLHKVLRSHGYDHTNLQQTLGKPVTAQSWQVGDLVTPLSSQSLNKHTNEDSVRTSQSTDECTCVGRIVIAPPTTSLSQATCGRETGMVSVEFVDPSFGIATEALSGISANESIPSLLTKRIRVNKLIHTTFFHGDSVCSNASKTGMESTEDEDGFCDAIDAALGNESKMTADSMKGDNYESGDDAIELTDPFCSTETSKKEVEIAGITRLEPSAIILIIKECEKGSASLAGMFAAGLPDAIISAIDHAFYEVTDSTSRRDVSSAISLLGKLVVLIAKQLFHGDVTEKSRGRHIALPIDSLMQFNDENVDRNPPRSEQVGRTARSHQTLNRRFVSQPNSLENAISHQMPPMELQDLIRSLDNDGSLTSTQRRRSLILALMSGTRMNTEALSGSPMAENSLNLNIGLEGSNQLSNSANHILSSFGQFRQESGIPPYLTFNQPGPESQSNDWTTMGSNRSPGISSQQGRFNLQENDNTSGFFAEERSAQNVPPSILESLLRGRGKIAGIQSSGKGVGNNVSLPVKSLVQNGLLQRNISWVTASLKVQKKRKSSQSLTDATTAALKNSTDEDGVSLLLLAISFGCPAKILNQLIQAGESVGEKEIFQAALTDQPKSLLALLRRSVYSKGCMNTTKCSPEVNNVLKKAINRQKVQEADMQNDGKNFVAVLIGKLLHLGLLCRRHRSRANKSCGRAVTDALIGNVLLHSMHHSQQKALLVSNRDKSPGGVNFAATADSDNGRVPFFESDLMSSSDGVLKPTSGFSSGSLFEVLPADVLRECLLSTNNNTMQCQLTGALLLAESHLWSKAIDDIAVGLTLVLVFLDKMPALRASNLIDRYGIRDLSAAHEILANDSRTEIVDHFVCSRPNNRASSTRSVTSSTTSQNPPFTDISIPLDGAVMCLKKHVAELHLTHHSSFRCDLCGKGVERGKPMYGCRECDWDACDKCTDKAEGGIMKWGFVLELANLCQIRLSETEALPQKVVEENSENIVELSKVSDLLRERDCGALKDLASLLSSPGRVTMHEFATLVLPALHSALIEKSVLHGQLDHGDPHFETEILSNRRSKRPRIWGSSPYMADSPGFASNDRADFCSKVVYYFIKAQEQRESGVSVSSNMDDQSVSDETGEANESVPRIQVEELNDDEEDDDKSDDASVEESKEGTAEMACFKVHCPEILRRLHDVLAFNEKLIVVHDARNGNGEKGSVGSVGGDLQSLIQPLEIELVQSTVGNGNYSASSSEMLNGAAEGAVVSVEPLMLIADLNLHVLRTFRIYHPTYVRFCQRLASEQTIIAERPTVSTFLRGNIADERRCRRLAQVVSFDERTGAHVVRFASRTTKFAVFKGETLDLHCSSTPINEQFEFDGETTLILAARDYQILQRNNHTSDVEDISPFDMETELLLSDADILLADGMKQDCDLDSSPGRTTTKDKIAGPPYLSVGTRVESNCVSPDGPWATYTILIVDHVEIPSHESQTGTNNCRYGLVSDAGEVFRGVSSSRIRGYDALLTQSRTHRRRDQVRHDTFSSETRGVLSRGRPYPMDRAFPFFRVRRPGSDLSGSDQARPDMSSSTPRVGVLKRSWSALSPIEDMNPLELYPSSTKVTSDRRLPSSNVLWTCSLSGRDTQVLVEASMVKNPPLLRVEFSAHETLPTVDAEVGEETTVYSAVDRLLKRDESTRNERFSSGSQIKVFYRVRIHDNTRKNKVLRSPCCRKSLLLPEMIDADRDLNIAVNPFSNKRILRDLDTTSFGWHLQDNRGRKHNATALENSTVVHRFGVCDGLNETAVKCMEIMCVLADFSDNYEDNESEGLVKRAERRFAKGFQTKIDASCATSPFESERLTKKLVEQLEDPLTVVGGALPQWCTVAPAFAPCIFSYASRRLLLERTAFGVSRSVLKQQESKVAVGPLRQRMAALRSRAVELVGEAFSGGAEDPTALQLQADELYGMEDALAARVSVAFRAQRWNERSLQCAKAAVRRDMLLSDAAAIMDRYVNDIRFCRRRLEIRFSGESGFDAASGNEAGVTRGFYADVAESLLSCEHVKSSTDVSVQQSKLPLWIPDMDPSRQVIIPTPRSDARSGLGVYSRPLSPHHPQFNAVVDQFRFMGRLFAAAMRDGFVFPLSLSTSFLKLVQSGNNASLLRHQRPSPSSTTSTNAASFSTSVMVNSSLPSSPFLNRNPSMEDMSVSEHSTLDNMSVVFTPSNSPAPLVTKKPTRPLNSSDLPRPGFLGGEVYAVESCVCAALCKLDEVDPPLSKEEWEKRCEKIASDKSFARQAMGKSFDCSFDEYFEGKTFVDPLDPAQGEEAMQLCPNGHQRSVTIYNVREWVSLAKEFILYDGVIMQALAFRQGVEDFFSADYLDLFTAGELQHDVCGGGDNVDKWDEAAVRSLFKLDGGNGAVEALIVVTAMGGEGGAALSRRFGPSSPTVRYLVRALLEASPIQRRQFLSFVTSVPIVTPGQIEVVPMVSPSGEFLPMRDPGCLPRANTCSRRLYLPKFESYESFFQVLLAVVREESKFKGFYEWRG